MKRPSDISGCVIVQVEAYKRVYSWISCEVVLGVGVHFIERRLERVG